MKHVYVPEEDNGLRIPGQEFSSASLWIPRDSVSNEKALIDACTFWQHTGSTRAKLSRPIKLARLEQNHIVIPRHFFSGSRARASAPNYGWESVDFGSTIQMRNKAQRQAWKALSMANFGTLNLACGKGKTVLALHKIAQRAVPAIVIVPSIGLLDQWIERACQFLNLAEDDIGIVRGKKSQWDKKLVVATVQTLVARKDDIPHSIRKRFGTVVFDEVHHMAASSFVLVADLFHGARYGLTATPAREDGLEDVYYSHIGGIFYTDLEGELNATLYFKHLDVRLTKTEQESYLDKLGEFSVGKFYQVLANKPSRNVAILKMVERALEKQRKVLVLVHSANHPEKLMKLYESSDLRKRYTAAQVSGKTKGAERTRLMEEADVTFATFGVAKEGLDVASLDTLIFATPFKAWGAFQQGKGRVERITAAKQDPIVVVVEDKHIGPSRALCRSLKNQIRTKGYRYVEIKN